MVRARFFSLGPRDVRDGRWSDGRRARGWSRLASRSRTEDRKTLRDGRWSEGRVGVGRAGTHVDRRRPMSACARRRLAGYVASHLGHRCTSTARPRGGTAAMTHTAGRMSRSPRPVRGVLGGITGRAVDGPRALQGGRGWGLRRLRCRFVVEIGPPERQEVSERAEDQTAARLVSEDLVIPGRGYACG
jgi:hypothetical protein